MEELKVGDVVCIASGGPKMTVERIDPFDGKVWTVWFVDSTLYRDVFCSIDVFETA